MGSRLLASWLAYPLTDVARIAARQDGVEELVGDAELREFIRQQFRSVFDLPRIVARLAQRRVTPRDLVSIRKTLEILPDLKARLANCSASLLNVYAGQIFPLEELADELRRALGDETPLNFRDGGFIETGYDARLDEYRRLQSGGKQRLAEFQASEIKKTGITTLKVGYNSVFGYYIEVTHAQSDKVPANYIRKQTLKNAERYITEELKAYEEKVLGAAEHALEREFELFGELVRRFRTWTSSPRWPRRRRRAATAGPVWSKSRFCISGKGGIRCSTPPIRPASCRTTPTVLPTAR